MGVKACQVGEQGLSMIFAADDGCVGIAPVEHVVECKLWRRGGKKGSFHPFGAREPKLDAVNRNDRVGC